MAKSARLEAEDVLDGNETLDFKDMRAICAQLATDAVGPPEPGFEIRGDVFTASMLAAARRLPLVEKWAAQVPAAEMVASVQFAGVMWQRTLGHLLRVSEEEYWRMVAMIAPHAGAILEAARTLCQQAEM